MQKMYIKKHVPQKVHHKIQYYALLYDPINKTIIDWTKIQPYPSPGWPNFENNTNIKKMSSKNSFFGQNVPQKVHTLINIFCKDLFIFVHFVANYTFFKSLLGAKARHKREYLFRRWFTDELTIWPLKIG